MAKKTYIQLSTELDEVLLQLNGEQLDVDEAIALYERGQKILDELDAYLKTAENKIKSTKETA